MQGLIAQRGCPTPTWKGIAYTEYIGRGRAESPRGSFATDNVTATRTLECVWGDLLEFARSVVGYPVLRTGTDGATVYRWVERTTPMPYHPFVRDASRSVGTPGPFLYATDIPEWHGVGKGVIDPVTGVANYPRARLTVVYSTLTYEVAEDSSCIPPAGPLSPYFKPDEGWDLTRHFTRFWRPARRVESLPFGVMYTVDDSVPANRLPARKGIPWYIPMAEITYVQHACPYVPFKSIQVTMNRLNNAVFDGRFPAETLLFLTPDQQPYFSPIGDRLYNHVWKFLYLPNVDQGGTPRGWNYQFVKKPGTTTIDYVLMSTTGLSTGNKTFRTADFSAPLRPDWG